MKAKSIITALLLLFVAASVIALVVNKMRGGSGAEIPSEGVAVIYFHSNARCPTCRAIESQAEEAIHSGFAEQRDAGRLHWVVVNYDEPGNEHYPGKFNFVANIVVLAERSGGQTRRWETLDRVWELVDDKRAFIEYVQEHTRAFLAGDAPPEDADSSTETKRENEDETNPFS